MTLHATIRGQMDIGLNATRVNISGWFISFFCSFLYLIQFPLPRVSGSDSSSSIVTDFQDTTYPLRTHLDFIQTRCLFTRGRLSHAQSRLRPWRGVDILRWIHRVSDSAAGGQPWIRTLARAHLIDTDKPSLFLLCRPAFLLSESDLCSIIAC